MLGKQAIGREWDEEVIHFFMIKDEIPVELYFPAKLLKCTFKRETARHAIYLFSTSRRNFQDCLDAEFTSVERA